MIVKNEERNLAQCLDSVRDLTGELIVVDTGSTDRTPLIAAGYGAKVIPFDFTRVDFAAARNHAIAHAGGRWILMLDADETLDRASAPLIERLAGPDENAGYFLERHNHSSEPAASPIDYVVRLFPNRPDFRFCGRVHETIDRSILSAGGRLHKTGIRIDHRFSSERETRRQKNHWYIDVLKEEIAADPTDDTRLDFRRRNITSLKCTRKQPKLPNVFCSCGLWTPGRICSPAFITCCISPIWRGRGPISSRR
jgi:glycosyltransferase involved in cell wall biosynthesis